MPTRDHYMTVAHQIADYLNSFGPGFQDLRSCENLTMIQAVAGEGADFN